MAARQDGEKKVCPVCGSENRPVAVLCLTCNNDLTFTPLVLVTPDDSESPEPVPLETQERQCENGHPMDAADQACLECGAPAAVESESGSAERFLTCGQYRVPLGDNDGSGERWTVVIDSRRFVIHSSGYEPDAALLERLGEVESEHVSKLLETGRVQGERDRWFEIWEAPDLDSMEAMVGSFSERPGELDTIARPLCAAVQALHNVGVLLRDLRPESVLVGSERLVISDLDQAAVADLGISREPTRITPAFLAPEAAVGVYEEASDWWSLGALLLELLTTDSADESSLRGHAALLNVVTRGIPVPDSLPSRWAHVLKGLLTRDPSRRWGGEEVIRWLDGERGIPQFYQGEGGDDTIGQPLELGGEPRHSPEQWALAAAGSAGWLEASVQLEDGTLSTWLDRIEGLHSGPVEEVDRLRRDEEIGPDERLACVIALLNDRLPLSYGGELVNPRWLLENVETVLGWFEGKFPERLERIERMPWIVEIWRRRGRADMLANERRIRIDRDTFRAASLVADDHQLQSRWARRRRAFPIAHARGLAALAEKDAPLPGELMVLLAAELDQFVPAEQILAEAEGEAAVAEVGWFDVEAAREWFGQSSGEMFRSLNVRLGGFVRCGDERLDEWADEFRFERRLSPARALVLLQVPEDRWRTPPEQAYLGDLLEYFHRRILRGIQQGPLLRLRVSLNSRNIDLSELDGEQLSADDLLGRIFSREDTASQVDPGVFIETPRLERRMRRLRRAALDYRRDTGIDSLYLGYPFLLIRPLASSATAKPKRAPLFLWPVEIQASGGSQARLRIGFDHGRSGDDFDIGGIEPNPALQTLLKQDEVDSLQGAIEEALARSDLDAKGFYELCAAALPTRIAHGAGVGSLPNEGPAMAHGEGHLYSAGALFLCDFSQQTIAKDIRQLRNRGLRGGALSRALWLPGSDQATEDGEETPEPVAETDKFFVLPADPSQQRAVLASRRSRGIVVQGPPGTGKSQTIVNILADCIGRGERALVVCQKHAALQVVARRLADEGLEDRFFMVEDAKRSRQPIIRALRSQTEASATWRDGSDPDGRDEVAARIERLEAELCSGADGIQKVVEPSKLTYAEIIDRLIDLDGGDHISAVGLRHRLGDLAHEGVRSIAESVASLAGLWYRVDFDGSPWGNLKEISPDPESVAGVRAAIEVFADAEDARNALVPEAGVRFDIGEPGELRDWLAENRPFLSKLPGPICRDAYRWRDRFDGDAAEIRAGLEGVISGIDGLEIPAGDRHFGKAMSTLSVTGLRELTKASQRVRSAESSAWVRFLPQTFFAKRRLAKFRDAHARVVEEGFEAIHEQVRFEGSRRKLLDWFLGEASKLGEGSEIGNGAALDEIASSANELRERLTGAEAAASVWASCPVAGVLGQAFSEAKDDSLRPFLEASDFSLRYADRAEQSLAALDRLKAWFAETWIDEKQQQMGHAVSTADEVAEMRGRLESLGAFLQFRPRYETLPESESEVFDGLAIHREEFEGVDEDRLGEMLKLTVEREALMAWKGRAESRDPALLMGVDEFTARIATLREACEQFRKTTAEQLRSPRLPDSIANATTWLEILMLRGARALRLREVFDQGIERGLFHLRPVWLASPEIVSRLFPLRENLFDVVIFDEASQMPVELAIPSLYRARRAIVSGDEKQLPPTNFFRSGLGDDGDEDDPDDALLDGAAFLDDSIDPGTRDRLAAKQARREVKDCGDLLQLATGEMPNCLLTIHYRSQWRHLIAFSNNAFYGGSLSVPVHYPNERVRAHRPLDVRRIDTPYSNQTNEGEAEAVIDFLANHWDQDDPPSVGVVTFNLKQADLIQDKIDERVIEDEGFRSKWEREGRRPGLEAFFVRNLENVQGDERDVVVFSTTFGPDENGRFIRNFGPASQRNGERRLNVAVTRSRIKMVIFTSLPTADIASAIAGDGSGPREILKGYLSFAELVSSGEFRSAEALLHRVRGRQHRAHDRSVFAAEEGRRAFVRSVVDFLKEEGLDPEPGGTGDAFDFDLALVDPATGMYGLAIECDPPQHSDLDSARAREIWRPSVMRGTIPEVIRLSSRAWFENRAGEQARLMVAAKRFSR